ncbi:MAG: hypothetical protein IT342_07120 [Candidatus Melainabacteria bacterium]|nr:hypothetical protein [Candidatus Melainabacteria bacterium]
MKNSKENEDCGCTNAAETKTIVANPADTTPAKEEKSLQPKSLLASDSVTLRMMRALSCPW